MRREIILLQCCVMGEIFALRFRYQMCWRPASPTRVPWSGPSAAWPVSWGNPFSAVGNELKVPWKSQLQHTHGWLYIHIQSCKRLRYYLSASGGDRRHFLGLDVRLYRHQHHISPNTSKQICNCSRTILSSPQQAYQQPTATSTSTTAPEGTRGNWARDRSDMGSSWSWSWFVVVVVVVVVWSCGRVVVGWLLGEAKTRRRGTISSSFDLLPKQKHKDRQAIHHQAPFH